MQTLRPRVAALRDQTSTPLDALDIAPARAQARRMDRRAPAPQPSIAELLARSDFARLNPARLREILERHDIPSTTDRSRDAA